MLGGEPERTRVWSRGIVGKHEEASQSDDDGHAAINDEQPSPSSDSMGAIHGVKDGRLQSAGHHAADSLATMVESHALCNFGGGVPVHCGRSAGRTESWEAGPSSETLTEQRHCKKSESYS